MKKLTTVTNSNGQNYKHLVGKLKEVVSESETEWEGATVQQSHTPAAKKALERNY